MPAVHHYRSRQGCCSPSSPEGPCHRPPRSHHLVTAWETLAGAFHGLQRLGPTFLQGALPGVLPYLTAPNLWLDPPSPFRSCSSPSTGQFCLCWQFSSASAPAWSQVGPARAINSSQSCPRSSCFCVSPQQGTGQTALKKGGSCVFREFAQRHPGSEGWGRG